MTRDYQEYLKSRKWKLKCKAVKERCNNVCERCHKRQVDDVHHLTYWHVYDEPLEDLQGLCAGCHEFVHGQTAIDPLSESTFVKVTWKLIEYWDGKEQKRCRVRRTDRRGDENYHDSHVGQYVVPLKIFLDTRGNPILIPSRWERFKTASKIGGHWYSGRRARRRPVNRPAVTDAIVKRRDANRARAEERQKLEEQRRKDNPLNFVSFKNQPPQTANEARNLLRMGALLLVRGSECSVRGVRSTLRKGIALDLRSDLPEGGFLTWSLHHADGLLREGKLILDCNRKLWILNR
jgi:hypothetical protein